MLMVKNTKQLRIGYGALVFLQTFVETQKMKRCNLLLSSYSNKHELIRLFFIKWKATTIQRAGEKVFYIALGFFYLSQPRSVMKSMFYQQSGKVRDTDATPFKTYHSPDTSVVFLCIAHSHVIGGNIYLHSDVDGFESTISIHLQKTVRSQMMLYVKHSRVFVHLTGVTLRVLLQQKEKGEFQSC